MKNKLRVWLWRLGLLPEYKCPICKSKLIGRGYDEFTGVSPGRFECEDVNCEFNN